MHINGMTPQQIHEQMLNSHRQPGAQQPMYQQPGAQQPMYQQPGAQQPMYQQPGAQQPDINAIVGAEVQKHLDIQRQKYEQILSGMIPRQPQTINTAGQYAGVHEAPPQNNSGFGTLQSNRYRASTVTNRANHINSGFEPQLQAQMPVEAQIASPSVDANTKQIFIYKEVIGMPSIDTLTHEVNTDAPLAPIPDTNMLGDEIYAGLRNALDNTDLSVINQTSRVEYVTSGCDGKHPSLSESHEDISKFLTLLKDDLNNNITCATLVDRKLTTLINLLLMSCMEADVSVDSIGLDYGELTKCIKEDTSDAEVKTYSSIINTLGNIVSNIIVNHDEITKLNMVTMSETHIVINDSLATSLEFVGSDETYILEKSPIDNAFKMLNNIVCDTLPIAYILTDRIKTMVVLAPNGNIITTPCK